MFIGLKRAIGILAICWKLLELALNKNKGKEACRGCLTTWISHILMTVCWEGLQSKRFWDLSCAGSRFVTEEISGNANVLFWSARKGRMHALSFVIESSLKWIENCVLTTAKIGANADDTGADKNNWCKTNY